MNLVDVNHFNSEYTKDKIHKDEAQSLLALYCTAPPPIMSALNVESHHDQAFAITNLIRLGADIKKIDPKNIRIISFSNDKDDLSACNAILTEFSRVPDPIFINIICDYYISLVEAGKNTYHRTFEIFQHALKPIVTSNHPDNFYALSYAIARLTKIYLKQEDNHHRLAISYNALNIFVKRCVGNRKSMIFDLVSDAPNQWKAHVLAVANEAKEKGRFDRSTSAQVIRNIDTASIRGLGALIHIAAKHYPDEAYEIMPDFYAVSRSFTLKKKESDEDVIKSLIDTLSQHELKPVQITSVIHSLLTQFNVGPYELIENLNNKAMEQEIMRVAMDTGLAQC